MVVQIWLWCDEVRIVIREHASAYASVEWPVPMFGANPDWDFIFRFVRILNPEKVYISERVSS